MLWSSALSPAPLTHVRRRSRAAFLVALGLRLVLAVAVFGVVAGIVASALWEPDTLADAVPVGDVCSDPPCPPQSLPGVRDLPVFVAPLGYLLAALLGTSALLLSLLTRSGWRLRRRALLPMLGPVVVLVAMEVVPHLVNPCLVAGVLSDSLPAGCSRTDHGVDVHDRWHALHHAVVGGLPAALGYAALLRRRRPELFARSDEASPPCRPAEPAGERLRAGAAAASVASTDSGSGRTPTDVATRTGVPVPVIVRIGAAAAALGGSAWVVKAGAILVTGDQPPLVFETAPVLLAVGLLGLRAMLRPAATLTRIGGWAAAVAVLLGAASLASGVGSTSSDGDFSPLILGTFLNTLAGLILLGLAARRRTDLPWPARTLPLLLGLLTFPLLAVGGALALIGERLLEVPVLVLGLAWIVLAHSMWTSGAPSPDEAQRDDDGAEGHPSRRSITWCVSSERWSAVAPSGVMRAEPRVTGRPRHAPRGSTR